MTQNDAENTANESKIEDELTALYAKLGIDRNSFRLAGQINELPEFRNMLSSMDRREHHFWRLDRELIEKGFLYSLIHLSAENLAALLDSISRQVAMPQPVNIGHSMSQCSDCREYVDLETDGVVVYATTTCECPPKGTPIEFELNVPSGELVYADDLRHAFDILGEYDINARLGLIKKTRAMAKIGCAHAFVGNSCPTVYRNDENTLTVAYFSDDRELSSLWEEVGSITTDLWWYSFVDAEEYKRRGGKDTDDVNRLKVKPGVYKFLHHLPEEYDDYFVFATIKWVREPDPVKDYLKESREANFTAGQVIAHMIKKWPTLYNGPDAVVAAANSIFCVYGGGGDWHPNGFVQYDPDMPVDTPDMEIGTFDRPYCWMPMCEYSALVAAAGLSPQKGLIHLNPSFVALARTMLECMIKHGTTPMSCSEQKGDPNLELAKQCLAALNERYPLS
jgi:hypothetical protein